MKIQYTYSTSNVYFLAFIHSETCMHAETHACKCITHTYIYAYAYGHDIIWPGPRLVPAVLYIYDVRSSYRLRTYVYKRLMLTCH